MRRLHLIAIALVSLASMTAASCGGGDENTGSGGHGATGGEGPGASGPGGGSASGGGGSDGSGGDGGSGGSAPKCPSPEADWIKVKDLGAKGDGTTDDRPAIQMALDNAKATGAAATIYFEPGIYFLGSATAEGSQLFVSNFDSGHPVTISLVGDGATLLTADTPSDDGGSSLLHAQGYWSNATICGLTFQSKHGLTHGSTTAIFLEGTGGNGIVDWTITANVFKSFSTFVTTTGVSKAKIDHNTFVMENGRDSGAGDDGGHLPTVGIWLHDNGAQGGTTEGVTITDNDYNGCGDLQDLSSSKSKSCGDGFVFGSSLGTRIENNRIRGFSAEAILINKEPTAGEPVTVNANTIDGTMIPGDQFGGGLWGVRADASNTVVTANVIKNAVTGVLSCSAKFCGSDDVPATGIEIQKNQISTRGSGTQEVYAGIQVLGIASSIVSGNVVTFGSGQVKSGGEAYGIEVSNAGLAGGGQSVQTVDNTLKNALADHGGEFAGILVEDNTGYSLTGNTVTGFAYGFDFNGQSGTMSDLQAIVASNTLTGNGVPYRLRGGSFGN